MFIIFIIAFFIFTIYLFNNRKKIAQKNSITNNKSCSFLEKDTRIVIPYGREEIYDGEFKNCSTLESIVIPHSVRKVGDYAFEGCKSLNSINLPYGLKSIGWSAFKGCSNLKSVVIPDTVTEIGSEAFDHTPFEKKLIEDDGIYVGNCLILAIQLPIRKGTRLIASNAFDYFDDKNITSITIPGSVRCIGDHAFTGLKKLTNIEILEGEGDLCINDCAFENLPLVSVKIFNTNNRFWMYGVFGRIPTLTTIYYPKPKTNEDYKNFDRHFWKDEFRAKVVFF